MSIGGMSGAGGSGRRLSPEGLSGRVDGLESGMLREAGADTRFMRRTESMDSLASTVVISLTDLRCLSPINEDVSQGSKNSSQRSSPVKTTEEGSSPNSSLIKREAGNLSNAQLMLISKRFEQENLSRWFWRWRGGVSSAILERSLKKHEIRRSNSEEFSKDVKKLSQMLIRVVGDKRVGKPVVRDIYFNNVLIAECILPSSDVAGVREVQSKLVVTIVTNLETLARQLVNLNSYKVPPKALLRNNFDNLECYLPSDLDKQKFLKCMIGADDKSLNYLVEEVVRGAVDWKIDFWKRWLTRLAFGDEFEKSDFWPDDPTRDKIAPKEITLDAVKQLEQCEQRHVNWKFWQQILVKHDDKNGQSEGFEEYRLLLLLLMNEARKRAVTMDQLMKVYDVEIERIFNPQEHIGAQWPYGLRELYEIESFSNRFQNIVRDNA